MSKKITAKKMLDKQEEEIKKTTEELRALVIERIIPTLKEMDLSVEESKMMLGGLTIAVQQAFANKQKEITIRELGLDKMVDPKHKEAEQMLKIIEIIADKDIHSGLRCIQDFPQFVDVAIRKEMQTRKLADLELGLV